MNLTLEVAGRDEPIDEPEVFGFSSAELVGEQVDLLALAATDIALHPRATTPARSDPHVDLRHSPARVRSREHEVAAERQLEASAHADPVDCRDRDAVEILEHRGRLLEHANEHEVGRRL